MSSKQTQNNTTTPWINMDSYIRKLSDDIDYKPLPEEQLAADLLDDIPSDYEFCLDACADGDEGMFNDTWPNLSHEDKVSVLNSLWWDYSEGSTPVGDSDHIKRALANFEKEISGISADSLTGYLFPGEGKTYLWLLYDDNFSFYLDNVSPETHYCVDSVREGNDEDFKKKWSTLSEREKEDVLIYTWFHFKEGNEVSDNAYIRQTLSDYEKIVDGSNKFALTKYLFP